MLTFLHGASQWDGDYAPIAENGTAVYIFMAEHDEYYGSQRAWSAYNSLHDAYEEAGWSEEQISNVLQIQTPNDDGSLSGALPAIIMAAAMWFFGKMMF